MSKKSSQRASAAASLILVALFFNATMGAHAHGWLPQARYIWPVLGAIALLFCTGTLKAVSQLGRDASWLGFGKETHWNRRFGIAAFLILALAIFLFDLSTLFNTIMPYYYPDSALGHILRKDNKPDLFNADFFNIPLFIIYFMAFFVFLVGFVKTEIQE